MVQKDNVKGCPDSPLPLGQNNVDVDNWSGNN